MTRVHFAVQDGFTGEHLTPEGLWMKPDRRAVFFPHRSQAESLAAEIAATTHRKCAQVVELLRNPEYNHEPIY